MATILGAGVLFAAPALASGPPVIESMTAGAGSEITVGADIDPEGLETTYEIWLECSSCDPSDQRAAGLLPAVNEIRAVTLTLSDLLPGRYAFAVRVSNAAGEASRSSDILEVPSSPGSFPNGTAPVEVVQAPYIGDSTGQLLAIAEREVKERSERELKEREARELWERVPASAETGAQKETEAATPLRRRARACVVPSLKGDTLSAAHRALAKAYCHLGKISRPPHRRGTLFVTRQNPRPGRTLPAGGRVGLTLGAKAR